MNEQQPGQGSTPEAAGAAPEMFPQEFYNTAGAVLSGAPSENVDVLPQHAAVVQAGLSGLTKAETATAQRIFTPPEGRTVVTSASTCRVLEQVVHGPTSAEAIGEATKLSPKIVTETLNQLQANGVVKRDTWGVHIRKPRLNMENSEGTVLGAVTQAATEILAESGRGDTYATKTEIVERAIAINPAIVDPERPQLKRRIWDMYTREYNEGARSRLSGITPTPGSGARIPNAVILSEQHRSTVEKVVRRLDAVRAASVTDFNTLATPAPTPEMRASANLVAPETKSDTIAPIVGATAIDLSGDPEVASIKTSLQNMETAIAAVNKADQAFEQVKIYVDELVSAIVKLKTLDPSHFNVSVAPAEHAQADVEAFSLTAIREALYSIKSNL